MLDTYQCPKNPELSKKCVDLFRDIRDKKTPLDKFLKEVYQLAFDTKDCLEGLRYRPLPTNPPESLKAYRNMNRREKWAWLYGKSGKGSHPDFFRYGEVAEFIESCATVQNLNKANQEKLKIMRLYLKESVVAVNIINGMLSEFVYSRQSYDEPMPPEDEKEVLREESIKTAQKEFGGTVSWDKEEE